MRPSIESEPASTFGTLPSPLLVYDWALIQKALQLFRGITDAVDGTLLYSIKAQPFSGLLTPMMPWVGGFAVSSLFEARLVHSCLPFPGEIHLTSPGIREEEIKALATLCSHINFNSLGQFERLESKIQGSPQMGLRINHGVSSIRDDRYNPCREASKLGVPLEELKGFARMQPEKFKRLKGLHFHSHFLEGDTKPLQAALGFIQSELGHLLEHLEWINLGGGYAPQNEAGANRFKAVLSAFKNVFHGKVILEPGNAIVGESGSLQAHVIDVFKRDGTTIAVLDTGVHHLPEVFEYQKAPIVKEANPEGPFSAVLAGDTCLAGDLFGTYRFMEPLTLGQPITFEKVGAYSLVKANRFNGHDFPGLALRDSRGHIEVLKQFGFKDYIAQWSP